MVRIRPLCGHHRHSSICRTLASRLLSWHRRNLCYVSVAWGRHIRGWRLLQIVWRPGASSCGHRYGNHWVLDSDCREGTPWPTSSSTATCHTSSWQYEPSISISLDPIRSIWLESNLHQTCVCEANSHLMATDTYHGFLLQRAANIFSTEGQMLKCECWLRGGLAYTTRHPCAPNICKRQNELVSIRLLPDYLRLPCTAII